MMPRSALDAENTSLPAQATSDFQNTNSPAHAEAGMRLEERVQRDVVRALYGQTPQALVIGLIFGAVFVYAFYRRVGATAWWWYAAMIASQAWGLFALLDFRRRDRQRLSPDWDIEKARRMFSLRAWSAGLLLGAMAWLFYEPQFGDARWLTVLCICGLAAGSITSYAYHLRTLYGFMFALCAPMWVRFVQLQIHTEGQGYWVAHALFLFYIVMLCWFGVAQHRLLVGSIRMRHENRELLQETRKKTLALEEANQAKARFFAAASHDLRQPLHAMGYYTSLLKPHAQDAPHVERIAQCVESLDGLLEGVLSISRLDAGKVQRHITAVDMRELLMRLQTLYEGVAQSKGLVLRLKLPQGSAWAQTDPVLMERVLGNLLSNALRYTSSGKVLLALRPAAQGALWSVQVIDTGPGIAADQLESIFDEFVQLNNPQRDPTQGVGLGLATVRRICTLLEHPLSVRSVLGRGSRFAVDLPVCAVPTMATLPNATDQTLLKGRVLMVEDNELVREALLHTLQGWGLQCIACADGDAAKAALQESGDWDVVISDWRLPGSLHGLQVLAIARQARVPHLFLMTGETDEMLGELPADVQLLPKPLRPLRLRALLAAQLTAASMH
jgi:two-component system, sensor histidine kinase